ncbi:hypothetical protein AAFF_G00103810 [Aldrovandia affinis]|uniref:Uncharacterized protein n=1 Tax=Aldrovandia affinis TaxID=143900 RepID=A0AAD7WAY7_9TELE|nr:hypothetical protein AAFF_G00103810 [Aldrovandia affinis]
MLSLSSGGEGGRSYLIRDPAAQSKCGCAAGGVARLALSTVVRSDASGGARRGSGRAKRTKHRFNRLKIAPCVAQPKFAIFIYFGSPEHLWSSSMRQRPSSTPREIAQILSERKVQQLWV